MKNQKSNRTRLIISYWRKILFTNRISLPNNKFINRHYHRLLVRFHWKLCKPNTYETEKMELKECYYRNKKDHRHQKKWRNSAWTAVVWKILLKASKVKSRDYRTSQMIYSFKWSSLVSSQRNHKLLRVSLSKMSALSANIPDICKDHHPHVEPKRLMNSR